MLGPKLSFEEVWRIGNRYHELVYGNATVARLWKWRDLLMSNSVVGGAEEQEKDELYENNDDDTARRGTALTLSVHLQ